MKKVLFVTLFVAAIAMIAVSANKPTVKENKEDNLEAIIEQYKNEPVEKDPIYGGIKVPSNDEPSASVYMDEIPAPVAGEPGKAPDKFNEHVESDEAVNDTGEPTEIDYARLRIRLTDNGFEAYYADKALPRASQEEGLTSANFETPEAYFAYMDALAASEVPSVLMPDATLHNNPSNEYGSIDDPTPILAPVIGVTLRGHQDGPAHKR